jgi:ethanolamine utilization protein EutA
MDLKSALSSPADRDHIWLTTVGIDVGSSTSHLSIARLHMQRLGDSLSSRFVTVERRIVHQSPITLTPYLPDGTIDAEALAALVGASYHEAGVGASDIDSGAVILTGEAVKRRNARAINERLADLAGSFVSTTAGPRLEALIAAHGSGSVALSRANPGEQVLNVDIGGGTTKFAAARDGRVEATGAISVGGRLVATSGSPAHRIERLERAGAAFGRRIGIQLELGTGMPEDLRAALGSAMADVVIDVITGYTGKADRSLWVTPPFIVPEKPDHIVFSGGVAQYVLGRETADFGDLGPALGSALRLRLEASGLTQRLSPPAETIRATVIGASQYTVQMSGNTVTISDPTQVPMRNLRVASPQLAIPEDLEPDRVAAAIREHLDHHVGHEGRFALAFRWRGAPYHERLHALAKGIVTEAMKHLDPGSPLVLLFDGDVARSIGELIRDELSWPGAVLTLDGLIVDDFDFVDIGARIEPAGSYPVVVKSLVYPTGDETTTFGA